MTITGLENNYYLSGNDIWVTVETASPLTLHVANTDTGKELPDFIMHPSPYGFIEFNISQVIRPLMDNATMRNFKIDFKSGTESATLSKLFLLGSRPKNGNNEWHLSDGAELIVGKWMTWKNIELPGPAQRISGSEISDFIPSNVFVMPRIQCDYKIIRFRNSLGGWQYYIFDRYEERLKTNPGKLIDVIAKRLRVDNFRQKNSKVTTTLVMYTKTPGDVQSVFNDLAASNEVYLFNPNGADSDAQWKRLQLADNSAVFNNWHRVFENKIEFEL